MEMKKTEIAILDSGIDENILALYGLYDVIQHSEGHTDDNGDLFMHGTNCAIIIRMELCKCTVIQLQDP